MSFLWPYSLWLLLLVPAAIAWRWLQPATASVPRGLLARTPGRARHAPPALFALAVALLLVAAARPATVVLTPVEGRTLILAIDVSGSMSADDVKPTRLDAAKAAAREFVVSLPVSARVGVVAFGDEAVLVQPPIPDREQVLEAIDSLQIENGTAIGRGLLVSLQAALPEERFRPEGLESAAAGSTAPRPVQHRPADASVAVILLTDGQNTSGPHPMDVAPLAAERGVRVYTVGVGTAHGVIRDPRGFSALVGIDEHSLLKVAGLTGGEYYYASSAPDLGKVYKRLSARVVLTKVQTEITALVCAAGALLATASAALSLFLFGRLL